MKFHERILTVVAVALFAYATSGCRQESQWRAAAASMRLEYGGGTGEIDAKRDHDTEGTWLAVSVQPFAFLDMEMRAQANAQALTEAQYAARAPLPPKPACGSK